MILRIRLGLIAALVSSLLAAAGCDRDKDAVVGALRDHDVPVAQLTKVSNGHYSFTGEDGSGAACTGTVKRASEPGAPMPWIVERDCQRLEKRGSEWLEAQRKACKAGQHAACTHVGSYLMDVVGTEAAEVEAREVLRPECDRGDATACGRYALLLFGSRGGPRDYAGSRAADTRACDLGRLDRCNSAGAMWMSAQGGAADMVKGRALFARGCNERSEDACYFYGMALHRGDGGPKDEAGCKKAMSRACKNGFGLACEFAKDPSLMDKPAEEPPGVQGKLGAFPPPPAPPPPAPPPSHSP